MVNIHCIVNTSNRYKGIYYKSCKKSFKNFVYQNDHI